MFTLAEARKAAVGHPEFAIKSYDGVVVFDYIISFPGTFDVTAEEIHALRDAGSADPAGECRRNALIRTNFRGITFNEATGEVVSLPLHKFFNINQTSETQFDLLKDRQGKIYEKADGCLAAQTPIEFCDGTWHPIGEVVKNRLEGPIWGLDSFGRVVPTKITAWHNNGYAKNWLTVEVEDRHNGKKKRSLAITDNHLCLTPSGYVEAGKLHKGDELLLNRVRFNDTQKSMLFGSLLGDMSLLGTTLQWSHQDKHLALSELKAKILSPYHSSIYRCQGGYPGSKEKSAYTVHAAVPLKAIADITYCGKKIVTREWLDALDDISLAFWYMDDGSLSAGDKNKQRPRADLHTEGFSDEENDIIVKYFSEKYGFTPSLQKGRGYTYLRLNADDAEVFWRRIAPYIIPDMQYKLPEHLRTGDSFWDGYSPEPLLMETEKTRIIRVVPGNFWNRAKNYFVSKYDITTETHNFFANGVCVHNSSIHFYRNPVSGEVVASTRRSSQTSQAQDALKLAKKLGLYEKICRTVDEGWTPVFEFVASHNQIVVYYDKPRLVYLISRNRKTGEYWFDESFEDKARRYDFCFSNIFDMLGEKEFEGYVCHLDNGLIVKAKTPWYMERHRAVTDMTRPGYKLYGIVFEGVMDDLIAIAADRFKPKLREIYQEAQSDLLREKLRIEGLFSSLVEPLGNALRSDPQVRKQFVMEAKKYPEFHMLMKLYMGREPDEYIQDKLMEGYREKYRYRLFSDVDDDEGVAE